MWGPQWPQVLPSKAQPQLRTNVKWERILFLFTEFVLIYRHRNTILVLYYITLTLSVRCFVYRGGNSIRNWLTWSGSTPPELSRQSQGRPSESFQIWRRPSRRSVGSKELALLLHQVVHVTISVTEYSVQTLLSLFFGFLHDTFLFCVLRCKVPFLLLFCLHLPLIICWCFIDCVHAGQFYISNFHIKTRFISYLCSKRESMNIFVSVLKSYIISFSPHFITFWA